jgi:RimJ/RimL family protein N-acetyltransferase
MDTDLWPVAGLRLRTPRLELRLPSERDLAALARLAAAGLHDPAVQPFEVEWTDAPPAEVSRSVLQHHWRQLADWAGALWRLPLAVVRDELVVGIQSVSGRDFATLREVSTGSWLGLEHQGRGTGTEMRAAVLHLAFAGLGALSAVSGAYTDNKASLAVSHKLGYADDGIERHVRRGQPATLQRLRLDRHTWQAHRSVEVTIDGLEPCMRMFGLDGDEPAPRVSAAD